MLFVSLKKVFLTVLFILGAGTLLLGYNGLAGNLFGVRADSVKAVDKPVQVQQGDVRVMNNGDFRESVLQQPTGSGRESFFVDYRLQRERSRSQQVELLKEIVNSPNSAGDARQVAQDQLLSISRYVAGESRLENLLKAKGYKEAVVCVDQKGVTVVVDGSRFSSAEEAKIVEIVAKETGVGEQGIVVIPKG